MPAQGFPDYSIGFVGAIAVPNGGTGLESIDTNAIMLGNLLAPVKLVDPGTSGQVLTMTGSPLAPGWADAASVPPSGAAGGDLGSNYPNPKVIATHLTNPLPIAQGGTGTASPALTAGENISITGSWPGETIALSASPSVTTPSIVGYATLTNPSSSSATTAVALWNDNAAASGLVLNVPVGSTNGFSFQVAGSTKAAISAAGVLTLGAALAIAQGGTGTASPALTAGENISITGSWPGETIALSASPSVTTPSIVGYATLTNPSSSSAATAVALWNDNAAASGLVLNVPVGSTNGFSFQVAGSTKAAISAGGALTAVALESTGTSAAFTFGGDGNSPHAYIDESGSYFASTAAASGSRWTVNDKNSSIVLAAYTDGTSRLSIVGLVNFYNGVNTAGQGLAPILYKASASGVTSGGTLITFTPVNLGVYRVSVYLQTTVGSSGSTLVVSGKEPGGTTFSFTVATTSQTASGLYYVSSAQNLAVVLNVIGATTVSYAVTVEQMV